MTNSKTTPVLHLKPGREKSLLRRHPWIFSGAIADIKGDPQPGDLVEVLSSNKQILGLGAYSPSSQIRCRMWEFTEKFPDASDQTIDELLKSRINTAIRIRTADGNLQDTDAQRLINAESDQLPGLIIDQYQDVLVIQFLSAGPEKYREVIIQHLVEELNPRAVFERSDSDVRSLEGLEKQTGLLYGEILPSVNITEHGIKFRVDFQQGHKTGFYLDQRENRKKLRAYCRDRHILDCFSYSGGFTLNAILGGARTVTSVDTAQDALDMLQNNVLLNDFNPSQVERVQNDVFKQLRLFRDQGRSFDVIVLDPPKFAPTRRHVERASRGYKDINLLAIKLLNPGGTLFTFSCSGGIDPSLFQQIVAGAALDAGANLQIIDKMSQASDHPVLSAFPEGEYLKGLICRQT